MSQESMQWLNRNVLIGFTDKRGHAWHYRASDQGDEPNHYPGAIPVADVERRLFGWEPNEHDVYIMVGDKFVRMNGDKVLVNPQVEDYQRALKGEDVLILPEDARFQYATEGYVTHSYKKWLLDNVSNILDDTLQIGSAGLIRNGGEAWVQVEMPDNISVGKGGTKVEFRPSLLATTSHNGTIASTYKLVKTIVVCDNTYAMAMREKGNEFKVKHTKNSEMRLLDARQALEIVHTDAEAFGAQLEEWCNTKVTDKQFDKFLENLYPLAELDVDSRSYTRRFNQQTDVRQMYNHDMRAAPWRGTAWGALQAQSTYQQQLTTVRGERTRAERNMDNLIHGRNEDQDNAAIDALNAALA